MLQKFHDSLWSKVLELRLNQPCSFFRWTAEPAATGVISTQKMKLLSWILGNKNLCLLKQNINSSSLVVTVVTTATWSLFLYSDIGMNYLGTAEFPIQIPRFPWFHTHLVLFKILGMIPVISKYESEPNLPIFLEATISQNSPLVPWGPSCLLRWEWEHFVH